MALRAIDALRDEAQHWFNEVSEGGLCRNGQRRFRSSADDCLHAGSGTGVVSYTYDHDDQMSSMTDWSSHTVDFTTDDDANLTGIT